MSGPTFSPDGDWMWNGTEWIPAPPKKEVLPQSSIDEVEISNIASELGVDPERLKQTAPYFDQNQDQVLQQSELQQAAMSIANQPNTPYPQPAHKQQLASAGVSMGGMMPASKFKAPHPLNWVSLGLTIVIITFTFIAMFSDSWMTGEEDEYNVYFGLSEAEFTSDNDSDYIEYSDSQCQEEDDCEDIGDAGTTGLIFLWFAVIIAIGSLVLIGLNSFGILKSKYFGMISSFVAGGLTLLGTFLWLIVFPDWDEFDDFDLGPGFAFYFALISGILGITVGILEIFAGRSGKNLNAPMYGVPQQQYGQSKQYKQW